MSMKVVLVAVASVMAVTPALAMSRSQIVNHTGGPIPYSQLVSMDKSGYNARSHKHKKASATTGEAVAANSSTSATAAPTDQGVAPAAPAATPAPSASDTTASGASGAVNASPSATPSPTPDTSSAPPNAGAAPQ